MASTYTPIATTTLGSAASSVTFNSFSGYTDLVLITTPIQTVSNSYNLFLQFNSDTGSNYSTTRLSGNGSIAQSGRATSTNKMSLDYFGYPNTSSGTLTIVQIMNYSNTSTYKTALARSNNASTGTDATVGLWRNTAAITSITLLMDGNQFATGSTFTLYGIKAA